jgi:hypothetical protein
VLAPVFVQKKMKNEKEITTKNMRFSHGNPSPTK